MLIRGFLLSYVVDVKHLYLMIIAIFWNTHFLQIYFGRNEGLVMARKVSGGLC